MVSQGVHTHTFDREVEPANDNKPCDRVDSIPEDRFQVLAIEVLQAVRGTLSQREMSRRLGYRGNPVTAWESGRRKPSVVAVLQACDQLGMDVYGAFRQFRTDTPLREVSMAGIGDWMDRLRGNMSVTDLAKKCGTSRFTVGRWFSGQTQPRFHEFLHFVEVVTTSSSSLVAELVGVESVPCLADSLPRNGTTNRPSILERGAPDVPVFNVTQHGYDRIQKLLSDTLREVVAIATENVGRDVKCVVDLQQRVASDSAA